MNETTPDDKCAICKNSVDECAECTYEKANDCRKSEFGTSGAVHAYDPNKSHLNRL